MMAQEAFVDGVECAVWSLIYIVHVFLLDYNWIISSSCIGSIILADDQSVENAGVAFVKEANTRNESFEKITNSNIWRTSPDEQGKGLAVSETNCFGDELSQVTKICASLRQ